MGNFASTEDDSNDDDIGNALLEKVRSFHEENAEKITGMLLEMPRKDLKDIFADETKLMSQIYEAIKILDYEMELTKLESFGDVLYPEVEAVYPEHETAEKITGMLLEMKSGEIEHLIKDKSKLLVKIHEAFEVLQTHSNEPESFSKTTVKESQKSVLGETIFESILQWYPDEETTAKLTGMLLEMNLEDIEKLTQNEELLKCKADEAYKVLTTQS